MTGYLQALAGGVLIGCSAALLLLANGQIAGVSSIASALVARRSGATSWRFLFLAGLIFGPVLFMAATGAWPTVRIAASWQLLIAGGLLVGFGARLGAGCTSGHGVCGLGRLSRRSIAAVTTFMATAILTVLFMRHGGLP
jgi:uncharacterized membrane protein YedE/YeeE